MPVERIDGAGNIGYESSPIVIPLANPLTSEINRSLGGETRNSRLRCLLAFQKRVQADQVDGGSSEDVGQSCFGEAEIAGATQSEGSHRLGMGSFNP